MIKISDLRKAFDARRYDVLGDLLRSIKNLKHRDRLDNLVTRWYNER